MSQAFDRIVARPNNTGPDYMKFQDGTTLTLDPDSAAFLVVELAKWLSRQNVILGLSATIEATSQAFEALGNPGVSHEIMVAVNEILAAYEAQAKLRRECVHEWWWNNGNPACMKCGAPAPPSVATSQDDPPTA